MSSSRTGFLSHGSCPAIAHQCFNFCDPPSRQQTAFVNAKGDCVSGPTPYRKSSWLTTASPEAPNQQLDPSRAVTAALAVKANPNGASAVPISQLPQHPAVSTDPYQCCKPSSVVAWEPYPPPGSVGAPGRLVRPAGGLGGHPHLHACYGPSPSIMVPLPPPPTSSRPPVAPRHHPAGSCHPSGFGVRSGGPLGGMPPPAPHQHTTQPHQSMGAPAGQLPTTTGPASTPGASVTTGAYPTSTPPPPLPGPPPGVWPWPWPQSHPLPPPPVATASPPANGTNGGAGGSNSNDGGWSASGGPGGQGAACRNSGGSWRLEDDDAAEDALQELLLEEIAAAPWPHVHIPSLRAAGAFIESYHSGRYDPALFAPWPLTGMPGPPPPMPNWTTAAASGMSVKQITTWEPMPMPPPLPPSMPHQPHLNQQQLPVSASSLPPMAPPLPPQLPPQPKHLVPQQATHTQSEMLLPQAQSASAPDGLLLPPPSISGSGNSMMEIELSLQSRNDDALFAAWLSEMGTGSGPQITALGGGSAAIGPALAAWGPQGLTTAAAPPVTSAAVAQQDSDYNRASFVSSPNSASMPTTPTVTNGRQRSDTGFGGGFTLSASASAAATAPSQIAAAAAAAAAVSAAVAVVAVVEAAADTAAAGAAAAYGIGADGKARVEEAMISDDGEAETVSGGLNAGGGRAAGGGAPVLGGPGTAPGAAAVIAVNYDGSGSVVPAATASLREQIYSTFDLPVADAARVLGISATELKRRCRRLGISRWPQRKLQSLRRIVQAAETDTSLTEDERKVR
ncbi:hypothetical protein Vafri_10841 [Volvox africanus]|uniref:RWP-RK domain-containing protein n=1 Tax=Volvox africanus TaxID=51714 RepID=A0A8J4BBF5_9CHLO|nr:hypothetical protein Vafri_10841 [Volvox africanus]